MFLSKHINKRLPVEERLWRDLREDIQIQQSLQMPKVGVGLVRFACQIQGTIDMIQ
jgi:hypothetical protein